MYRRRLFLLALVALCPSLALAGDTGKAPESPVPLWPKEAPGEKGDIGPEKVLPRPKNDNTELLTNVTRPTLTVYLPPAERATGAAVLICPGGGYNILAWDKEGTEVAAWLNSIGVAGVVLKYRVPARKGRERYAAPLEDAQRAMGLVRSRAKEWGIDPDRLGVLGFSAGGHLAAALSTNWEKRAYEPVDAADRESCRPDFALLIYPAYLVTKDNKLAPELKVTSRTPPTFIVLTEDDPVRVECGLYYYQALKSAGVPAEMHLFPRGGHGYGLRPSKNAVSHWPQLAETWLRSLGVLERKQ